MTINRTTGTCIVVHLEDGEAHLPTVEQAQEWASHVETGVIIRAIEPAQTPCWTADCDTPGCDGYEGDENGNQTHLPARTIEEAEALLGELKRDAAGRLVCTECVEAVACPAPVVEAWIDKQGDVWRLGDDGLMHTYETAPFPREYVEKKWGPLRLLDQHAASHH